MKITKFTKIISQDSGKEYMIREIENDIGGIEFECNCPAFLFHNPAKKPCKHLVQYLLKKGDNNDQK